MRTERLEDMMIEGHEDKRTGGYKNMRTCGRMDRQNRRNCFVSLSWDAPESKQKLQRPHNFRKV